MGSGEFKSAADRADIRAWVSAPHMGLASCAPHHTIRAPTRTVYVIDRARPVRVFKNWKHGCYSIMQDGVVRASAREVKLHGVEFLVRASGRARMLRLKRKLVHAYAVGLLEDFVCPDDGNLLPPLAGRIAFYDPYRFDSFVDRDTLQPVFAAEQALLCDRGLIYLPQSLPAAA